MQLTASAGEQQLRSQLRSYFTALLPPQVREELAAAGDSGPLYRSLVRRLGADGWLGLGWPTEWGGQGGSPALQFVVFEEAVRANAPVPFLTLNTVGPMLMARGTPAQQAELLPRIVRGELIVAVGYTEPESGTDLASLRTAAVRDGDHYVVSGTKAYTSHAQDADYIWLACRTDPLERRHRGITILLVPTDAPGFSTAPIITVGGQRTNMSYYRDVRVPVANRVGEEGAGWQLITSQLTHERIALAAFGGLAYRLWEEVRDWAAAAAEPGGGSRLELPWVARSLAMTWARLQGMRLLNETLAADTATGQLRTADASAAKVYATECLIEVYATLLEILGPAGWLPYGSPGSVLLGEVERAGRATQVSTFAGGVNEIQRELIAVHGLGLPRVQR